MDRYSEAHVSLMFKKQVALDFFTLPHTRQKHCRGNEKLCRQTKEKNMSFDIGKMESYSQ